MSTEPLSDELIERISPLRGAFSDIRPVINYYRVTRENRLLFGSATRFVEYTPNDFAAWNRTLLAEVFASQGCEDRFRLGRADGLQRQPVPANRHPRDHNNVFYVRGTPASASPRRTSCAKSSPKGSTAVPTAIAC
ncbi:hypothetical protein ACLFLT_13720 [Klebsiella pneumoniae]